MLKDLEKAVAELTVRVDRLESEVFQTRSIEMNPHITSIEASNLDYVRELGSAIDMCLAILDHAFQSNVSDAGLTPNELVSILKQKFGLPFPLPTVSSSLYRKTGRYVTREIASKKPVRYRYRILPRGQEYIRQKIRNLRGRRPELSENPQIPIPQ